MNSEFKKDWFLNWLKAENRKIEDVQNACVAGEIIKSVSKNTLNKIKYDNWKAISYAKEYCGKENNVCGVFLNEPNKTDCAHFIAHCLHAGGITIKTSDSQANWCPQGLTVRNTDLVASLRKAASSYENVKEIGLADAIIGDIGFLSNLLRPSHAFMLCQNVDLRDPLKPATVYAHTTNRCCNDMNAEIRQWFATLFRIEDDSLNIASEKDDEIEKWKVHSTRAKNAFAFWNNFLRLRMGVNNGIPLDQDNADKFLKIIRAVSWVESKHGTSGENQPTKDPMQAGNPDDTWWTELIGNASSEDRFITGPGGKNYDASELPGAVDGETGFPTEAKLNYLQKNDDGHKDPKFNPVMSYYWSIPYLIHRANKSNGGTYKCGEISRAGLVNGAVLYNGGGDSGYRTKIERALTLIGWESFSQAMVS